MPNRSAAILKTASLLRRPLSLDVLVIDPDNALDVSVLPQLRAAKLRFDCARNHNQAFSVIDTRLVDAIVLHGSCAGLDTVGMIDQIRHSHINAHTRVVALLSGQSGSPDAMPPWHPQDLHRTDAKVLVAPWTRAQLWHALGFTQMLPIRGVCAVHRVKPLPQAMIERCVQASDRPWLRWAEVAAHAHIQAS